jgi:hypothetical protein
MSALSSNWPWWTTSVPSPLRPQPYESPDARRAKFDERNAVIDYLGRHFAAADPEDADLIWLLMEDIKGEKHRGS